MTTPAPQLGTPPAAPAAGGEASGRIACVLGGLLVAAFFFCFWGRNADNFTSPDDRTVYLRVGVRQVYELKLFSPCIDIDWSQHIALSPRPFQFHLVGLRLRHPVAVRCQSPRIARPYS